MERLHDVTIHRVAFVGEGDNPLADLVLWKERDEVGPEPEGFEKRTFSTEQRVAAAKAGNAIPVRNDSGAIVDGRYPIENVADLMNAARAIGRVAEGDRAKVIAHIKRRARALGAVDRLGETFKELVEKAPRLTDSRVSRLRAAYDALGEVIEEAGRKEESMTEPQKTLTLPDDLPEDVRKSVEGHVAAMQDEIDAAQKERDEATAKVEELSKEKTSDEPTPTDPIEKALADPEVSDVVKEALRAQKERADAAEKAREESDERLSKELEERAFEKALAKVEGWKYLALNAEEFAKTLRSIEKHDSEAAEAVETVLSRANAAASESLLELGKRGATEPTEAEETFDKKAEEIAKEKGITKEQAYGELAATAEGRRLMREREEV